MFLFVVLGLFGEGFIFVWVILFFVDILVYVCVWEKGFIFIKCIC